MEHIRPGFEKSFMAFVASGSFGKLLPADHPYMTIAEEVKAYAQTNYPGIPPANPEEDNESEINAKERGLLIGEWYEYTPSHGTDIEVNSILGGNA